MKNHLQHQSFSIRQLSNKELLSQTKCLVQKERDIHIQVLRHLAEINSRKLYFRQGFSSLFDYAVRELGYSEGAAYRRIKAMKLCQALPQTANRLQSGALSLSVASQLQVFFEKQNKKAKQQAGKEISLQSLKKRDSESERQPESEEKQSTQEKPDGESLKEKENQKEKFLISDKNSQNEKSGENPTSTSFFLNQKEKENLVKRAEGCSTRAADRLLSEADPTLSLPKEQIHFLGNDKVQIQMITDKQCHKELDRLKNLLSHRNPNLSYGELISIISKEALKKHDPEEKPIRQQKKKEKIQAKALSKKNRNLGAKLEVAVTSRKLEKSNSSQILSDGSANSESDLRQTNQVSENSTSAPKSGQKIKKISRYIPFHLKKYIWKKDKGQCAYVHHKTKRRCSSRHLLQIDHIQPFALGGKTEKENLRLLCAGHNQYRR